MNLSRKLNGMANFFRDGQLDGKRTQVRVSCEMIHGLPMYNDAIEREIQRDKEDIFERLKPSILVDLSCNKK